MKKELDKLNKAANFVGFDISIFAGIPIAAIPLFFIVNNYKTVIPNFIEVNISPGYQQTTIILILTLIASIIIYKILETTLAVATWHIKKLLPRLILCTVDQFIYHLGYIH